VLIWPRSHTNFPIFAAAAQNWINGQDLYFVDAYKFHGLDHFRYSPLVATLLVPFGALPEQLGGLLWRGVNAAVCFGALTWWLHVAAPVTLSRTQRGLMLLLVVPLTIASLNNGQSNPLVIGLILAGLAAVTVERWNLAAGCVALASLFKVYPLAIGLLLVVLHPRRFAWRLAVALALGLALPFVLQRPEYVAEQYNTWFYLLWGDDRRTWAVEHGYQDMWMLFRICNVPISTSAYLVVQLAVAALIALSCLAGRIAGWPGRQLLAHVLVLGTCWMTLLGPATEASTYALLAPAVAWAVVESRHIDRPLAFRALPLLSLGLFIAAGVAGWLPWRAEIRAWGLHPLAALVLIVGQIGVLVGCAARTIAGRGRSVCGAHPTVCTAHPTE
jgi:Glycosyltransferase family 87